MDEGKVEGDKYSELWEAHLNLYFSGFARSRRREEREGGGRGDPEEESADCVEAAVGRS
jgi:hypothetical protein